MIEVLKDAVTQWRLGTGVLLIAYATVPCLLSFTLLASYVLMHLLRYAFKAKSSQL